MMKVKIWGLLILLGGVLFAHGPAWGAACVDGTTVTAFIALGATGCDNGTLRYSRDTSPGTTGSLGTSLLSWDISGISNSIALDFQDGIATTPGTYTFDYNVTILNVNTFLAVALDSNCSSILIPNSCLVTKQEQSGPKFTTLVSNNGSSDLTPIPGGQTTLSVLDTMTIDISGNLISISNAYATQFSTVVPEPSTFIMLGIGLAALGVLRRSRLRSR